MILGNTTEPDLSQKIKLDLFKIVSVSVLLTSLEKEKLDRKHTLLLYGFEPSLIKQRLHDHLNPSINARRIRNAGIA